MKNLLVWDIDGTLIQGRGIGRRTMNNAFFEVYGIENALDGVDMAGMLDSIIFKNTFIKNNMLPSRQEELLTSYYKHLLAETVSDPLPYAAPGVPELLSRLTTEKGFYHALGTGNLVKGAEIKLKKDDLYKYFPVGGFGDEEMERWEIIKLAIDRAKTYYGIDFTNENIYIIGDTNRDIDCGLKLGVKTIGVATGPYSVDQLKNFGADYVFNNFSDGDQFLQLF